MYAMVMFNLSNDI